MSSLHFYRTLPALVSFDEAMETGHHSPVPSDWWIVVADVMGSTQAIEAGAYKAVNTVGVACIAVVVNVDRSVEIPFVFGGDGANFAVPGELLERLIPALRAAQRMARESFGLSLRVGLVRVADMLDQGLWVRLAKLRLSSHGVHPAFSGRGWHEAERLVKDTQAQSVLRVDEHQGPCEGSFEGFECRWQSVSSFYDHKLALLVAALPNQLVTGRQTYRHVSDTIGRIYGDVSSYHPLRADRMRLSFNPVELGHEWRVRTGGRSAWRRAGYFLRMILRNLAGAYLFATKKDTSAVQWSRYTEDVVENSDFRKFDGMLRMVIDGSEAQYLALQAYLDDLHQRGQLVYGLHKSREALLTCIVFAYQGHHMHFVDGSDGGYAMAALKLKQQLKARERPGGQLRTPLPGSIPPTPGAGSASPAFPSGHEW